MAIIKKNGGSVIVEFDDNMNICYKIDKENKTMSLCFIDINGQDVSLVLDCKSLNEVNSNIYMDYLIDYSIDMKNNVYEMYNLQKDDKSLLTELEQYASLKAKFEGVDEQSTLEVMRDRYCLTDARKE